MVCSRNKTYCIFNLSSASINSFCFFDDKPSSLVLPVLSKAAFLGGGSLGDLNKEDSETEENSLFMDTVAFFEVLEDEDT